MCSRWTWIDRFWAMKQQQVKGEAAQLVVELFFFFIQLRVYLFCFFIHIYIKIHYIHSFHAPWIHVSSPLCVVIWLQQPPRPTQRPDAEFAHDRNLAYLGSMPMCAGPMPVLSLHVLLSFVHYGFSSPTCASFHRQKATA
jgi:hypothetical protein